MPSPADMAAGSDPVISRAAALLEVEITPEQAGLFFPLEWEQ